MSEVLFMLHVVARFWGQTARAHFASPGECFHSWFPSVIHPWAHTGLIVVHSAACCASSVKVHPGFQLMGVLCLWKWRSGRWWGWAGLSLWPREKSRSKQKPKKGLPCPRWAERALSRKDGTISWGTFLGAIINLLVPDCLWLSTWWLVTY